MIDGFEVRGHLPRFNTDLSSAMERIVDRMYSDSMGRFTSSGYGTWEATREGEPSNLGGREGKIAQSISKTSDADSATLYSMYAIHQRGGLMMVTEKMRSFFWAKWYETNEEKWKWMALNRGGVMKFPVRTYLTFLPTLLEYAKREVRMAAITTEEVIL
jgi:phage gpG-like protein